MWLIRVIRVIGLLLRRAKYFAVSLSRYRETNTCREIQKSPLLRRGGRRQETWRAERAWRNGEGRRIQVRMSEIEYLRKIVG